MVPPPDLAPDRTTGDDVDPELTRRSLDEVASQLDAVADRLEELDAAAAAAPSPVIRRLWRR